VEWAQWLQGVFKQSDFDMTIIAHVEPHDLDIYARDHYYFNYHSDAFKALYQRYLEALDPATQLSLLGDMQRQLAEDEPNVFLFLLPKIGVWNAKLEGLWRNSPIFANDLREVEWRQ
jgi:peptide/nickel transport system substrate-binding protein